MFWFAFLQCFIFFGVMKILIKDWKIGIREFIALIIFCLVQGHLYEFIGAFIAFIMLHWLFLVLLIEKAYNTKKSVILAALSMIIVLLFDLLALFLGERIFFLDYGNIEILFLYHLPLTSVLSVGFTLILVILTNKLRSRINQNDQLQTMIMSVFLLILGVFYGSIIFGIQLGSTFETSELNLLFFIRYVFIAAISCYFCVYFFGKVLQEKYTNQKQKAEQEILHQYTTEIEQQHREMRMFKHDYQNIVSSLEGFIVERDYEGLHQYFFYKIKPTSKMILANHFQLEQLSRIKPTEIKSILAVKLMVAQGHGIDVNFEAVEEIASISIDSLVLVRTLGILLDNAIEALLALKKGGLSVAVFKNMDTTTFVIQNACCPSTPPVHQLMKEGVSTKGEGRGVGLSNVKEFTQKYPNLSLQTIISPSKDQFIQKIIIGG